MHSRTLIAVVAAVLLTATADVALAAQRGTPEYQRLVELKKAQRAEREAAQNNPEQKPMGFWQKEAQRSGFAGTAAMLGNGVDRVIPGESAGARNAK